MQDMIKPILLILIMSIEAQLIAVAHYRTEKLYLITVLLADEWDIL